MVAATGVLVAAVFYILNLRETARNRKLTLTSTLLEPFMTLEGVNIYMDLVNMEWKDLEDYKSKYDSRVNPKNYVQRVAMWNRCDNIGKMFREGLIDLETLRGGGNSSILWMWVKFKPIIEMYRGTDYPKHVYENWEYVADKLNEIEVSKYGEGDLLGKMGRVLRDHEEIQRSQ